MAVNSGELLVNFIGLQATPATIGSAVQGAVQNGSYSPADLGVAALNGTSAIVSMGQAIDVLKISTKAVGGVAGLAALAGLANDMNKMRQEVDPATTASGGKITDSTILSAMSNASALLAAVAGTIAVAGGVVGAPLIVAGLATAAAVGLGYAALVDSDTDIADAARNLLSQAQALCDAVGSAMSDFADAMADGFIDMGLGFGDWLNDLGAGVVDAVNDAFNAARDWVRRIDPLVLDLDGDGVETIGANGTVLFDHDGDGNKHASGWIKPDDGLLVLDRNGNGMIDNGAELFGVETLLANGQKAADGFAALASIDSNNDGMFDASDAQYGNVRVWRDLNQNGVSEANELKTLAETGVASIDLNAAASSTTLAGGNRMVATGTYTRTDGIIRQAASLDLATGHFWREFGDTVPLTEAAKSLPNMGGSGAVRDLREAASLSTDLANAVAGLEGLSRAQALAQMDAILDLWADTRAGFRTSTEMFQLLNSNDYWGGRELTTVVVTGSVDWKQSVSITQVINILEVFNGDLMYREFDRDPSTINPLDGPILPRGYIVNQAFDPDRIYTGISGEQASLLQQGYAALKKSVYAGLVQLRLQPYLDEINLTLAADSGIAMDFGAMNARLDAAKTADPANGLIDLIELYQYTPTLRDMGWNGLDRLQVALEETDIDPGLQSALLEMGVKYASGSITGTAGRDVLVGQEGDDVLSGGGEADLLIGGAGNDTITGGAGADTLIGGLGNDILNGGGDVDILIGSAGNDTLTLSGSGSTGTLDGGDGDDTLQFSTETGGTLLGGAGNDTLAASYWTYPITFVGGLGNDTMSGGHNADTYRFDLGDGKDRITDYQSYTQAGINDRLVFGPGIAVADIKLTRTGNDLVFQHVNGQDSVTVVNWFSNAAYRIENIEFADGTIWTSASILQKDVFVTGSDTADTLSVNGAQGKTVIQGLGGNDTLTLSGSGSTGTLDGGDGDDTLQFSTETGGTLLGGAGNDTLAASYWTYPITFVGGLGNDTMSGGHNADTYRFDLGDGKDRITDYQSYTQAGINDRLVFGPGIAVADIKLTRTGNDLVFQHVNGQDSVTVVNWFSNAAYRIEQMWFGASLGFNLTDVQLGNMDPNTFNGGAGDSVLFGEAGDDTLNGNGGNDLINGGLGADTMVGGLGNDTFIVDNVGDVVTETSTLATEIDTVLSSVTHTLSANVENLTLTGTAAIHGTGNDLGNVLIGNGSNNTLTGGLGNDILDGGAGADIMAGGLGNDYYVVDDAGDIVTENAGEGTTDSIDLYLEADYTVGANIENVYRHGSGSWTTTGTAAGDTLYGNSGNDTLIGLAGNDLLWGGAGVDVLMGGVGDDRYYVDDSADIVIENANEGVDTIYLFGEGPLTYTLGANVENGYSPFWAGSLTGNALNNMLSGSYGADTLDGGLGADTLNGWGGNDTYVVDNVGDIVTETSTLATEIDTVLSSVTYTLSANVENLTLTGDAVIDGSGNALANVLRGNSAANILSGLDGDDTIYAGDSDTARGGNGNDTLISEGTSTWTYLYGEAGDDVLTGGPMSGVLVGGAGNDTITGGAWYNFIWGDDQGGGGGGNDTIIGGNDYDFVIAGAGDDVVYGNGGDDNLSGNQGNDILNGGAGYDTLIGGNGNDTFVVGRGYGVDTVVENDVTAGNVDVAQFLSGVGVDQIWFQQVGSNLEASIIGTTDKLVLQDWYLGDAYRVEEFKTADGNMTLLSGQVENLVSAMAGFAPPAAGQTTLPQSYQDALAGVIAANWQ